jgi:hypothetical protein
MLGRIQAKEETGDSIMPLTHDFKETIRARAQRDAKFRRALLREAVECIVNGTLRPGRRFSATMSTRRLDFQTWKGARRFPSRALCACLDQRVIRLPPIFPASSRRFKKRKAFGSGFRSEADEGHGVSRRGRAPQPTARPHSFPVLPHRLWPLSPLPCHERQISIQMEGANNFRASLRRRLNPSRASLGPETDVSRGEKRAA